MTRTLFRSLVGCLLLAPAFAQSKPLHSQDAKQKAYEATLESLQSRGTAALDAEQLREKSDECATAGSNADRDQCAARDLLKTANNYKEYARAINNILRLKEPDASAVELSLTPNKGREFQTAERYWLVYRDTQCKASSGI